VRVNCVAPGIIVTKGLQRQMGVSPADTIERRSVKRRMGRTDELVDVVQFLASPASSYIVGETIRVQGVPRVEEKHEVEKPHSWLE
jgi:NAD(P)-dependent dehydrogenase (short-subunit alcohol dehydrogenase family)